MLSIDFHSLCHSHSCFPTFVLHTFHARHFWKILSAVLSNNYNHMYNGNKNKSHALMNMKIYTHSLIHSLAGSFTHGKFTCNTLTVILCVAHSHAHARTHIPENMKCESELNECVCKCFATLILPCVHQRTKFFFISSLFVFFLI